MTNLNAPAIAAEPYWDGRRILFEVIADDQAVPCAISMNALQDLSTQRRFKPADLLKCFAAARNRIEAIALNKYRTRPGGGCGLLHIWSDDVDEVPAADTPAAGRALVAVPTA
jgi:hypothetical protein